MYYRIIYVNKKNLLNTISKTTHTKCVQEPAELMLVVPVSISDIFCCSAGGFSGIDECLCFVCAFLCICFMSVVLSKFWLHLNINIIA